MTDPSSAGEILVRLLALHGIELVFGIPGVHTLELYRALVGSGLRHVTPRHEQGAGFMADGVARVTGQPGVAFVITGPGMTNIATPLAQAMSDSMPMLVISAVAARRDLGMDRLRLHEITDQRAAIAPLVGFSRTVLDAEELPRVVARAFAGFAARRPRPAHIELPLDVISAPCTWRTEAIAPLPSRPAPDSAAIARAADLLRGSRAPLILLGGGAVEAAAEAAALAERLGAPVMTTTAGAGILPGTHPLCLGLGLSTAAGLAAVAAADTVLVVGSDMSDTTHFAARLPVSGLVRVDIDADAMPGDEDAGTFITADARLALAALADAVRDAVPREDGPARARAARQAIDAEVATQRPAHVPLLAALRRALPADAHLFTDMTQIAYTANSVWRAETPRSLLHPTGYGTLGFALPAAIGAKLARPHAPVACLIGDGGMQFTLTELATAVEERVPLPIVVYDNDGYGEIRDGMRRRGIQEIGVSPAHPDFALIAAAYGMAYVRPVSLPAFEAAVGQALAADGPTILHVNDRLT